MREGLELFTVSTTDSIRTAMEKITANRYRAVVVLDGKRVVGTVSDGDIRRAFLKDVLPIAPVEQIMNTDCRTTTQRNRERQRQIIQEERVTVLPVVDEENDLVDIVLAYEPFGREQRGDVELT